MKGIELLRSAKSHLNDLQLPPKYSIFSQNFKLGRNALRIEYININGELIQLNSINYITDGYDNVLSHFLDLSSLRQELLDYLNKVQEYNSDGFIKIGLFDINDSLLLKIDGIDVDSIWIWSGDWGDNRPEYKRVASSIFDFIEDLELIVIQINLMVRAVALKQLYKNWGEDFWRVREEGTEV
jgi:hypothetical protein